MLIILLLIIIAAFFVWYFGYRYLTGKFMPKKAHILPRDYFVGLKYLIDEQPDKAVDIFVKLLEVNSDTVETHLALGGLFRKRGEVNRAIRIHQNLIARPQLDKNQKIQALFELAQDYRHAGVFDRAEKLFQEIIRSGKNTLASFRSLLDVYEQQKEWKQAIGVAKKMEATHGVDMTRVIAHYYCELGDEKKALMVDKNCVRAALMRGDEYFAAGDYKMAIRGYQHVYEQDPNYIAEIILPLADCYKRLGKTEQFICYLQDCLNDQPRVSIILALANVLKEQNGNLAAVEFISEKMRDHPSLRGLDYMTALYAEKAQSCAKEQFLLLQTVIKRLLNQSPVYRCTECGLFSKSLYWQCPACKKWSVIKPIHGLEHD